MATRYLQQVYSALLSNPLDLAVLKKSLEELLEYLAGVGRSYANCWAVDLFSANSEEWERDLTDQALPDDFHDVLAMMGEALHDTVAAPDVAANFDCLAEQLLERVRRLGPA
ncbi:MAG TPA: hypothetical protein VFI82_16615 [Terriglobales bacterium]|jgi:hypothetical protein|nr:hypothetical protein [Terriglobales bacterium]